MSNKCNRRTGNTQSEMTTSKNGWWGILRGMARGTAAFMAFAAALSGVVACAQSDGVLDRLQRQEQARQHREWMRQFVSEAKQEGLMKQLVSPPSEGPVERWLREEKSKEQARKEREELMKPLVSPPIEGPLQRWLREEKSMEQARKERELVMKQIQQRINELPNICIHLKPLPGTPHDRYPDVVWAENGKFRPAKGFCWVSDDPSGKQDFRVKPLPLPWGDLGWQLNHSLQMAERSRLDGERRRSELKLEAQKYRPAPTPPRWR